MKRQKYNKTQIAIWVISLLVVVSMLCGLVSSLFYGNEGGTSMAPQMFATLQPLAGVL